jgi:hypothetical protein
MNAIRRSTLARRLISGWLVAAGPFAAAHAADLPTLKAAPIAYVMTCNVGGMAGFVIPGSDTCLRISGYVNLEIAAGNVTRQSGLAFTGVPGASPVTAEEIASGKSRDALGFTARGQVDLDVRQQTAYGVLRAYAEIQGINSNGFETALTMTILNVAYVQWAGLTVGKAPSFFSYLAGGPSWYDFYSPDRVSTNQPDVFAYTATFGGGFSATISFEDGTGAQVNNGFNGGFNNTYLGYRYPDIVAAARADESWGSAQLSAVAHNTRVIGVSGDTGDFWGYAVLAGATANLPWLGNGDKVALQGVYSHAALGYSGIPNTSFSPGDQGMNINGNGLIYQLTDALNYDVGSWSTPTAWTAAAFLEHHFSPEFSLIPEISFATVRYSNSPVMISTTANSVLGGLVAHWDPIAHLDFQAGIMVEATRQATPASYVGPASFPTNSSGLAGTLSITRDF